MHESRIAVYLLIIGALFSIVGCAANPIAVDLAGYVNQGVLNIAELESASLERYASVTGANYTDDKKAYETLNNEVIPLYGRFLDNLKKITPAEDEVKKLHSIYIRGAEMLYQGFRMKALGIEKNDPAIIRMANEKIEQGAAENARWRSVIMAMYKKYGVAEDKNNR